jgi:queuine tRNA-ribosyltransferase
MKKCFKITAKAKNSKARTGLLTINKKKAKTPFFMPVATKAVGKFIGPSDYNRIGIKTMISNSLLLFLNPGLEHFKKSKGIHNFMGYKNILFTDSGGFQMIRKGFFLKRSKRAVHFKDPATRQVHIMTPERVMDTALIIKPDVAMVLDDLAPANATYEQAKASMENTHRWAKKAIDYHESKDPEHKQKVFGISQGCFYEGLRKESAKYINSLNFDGIAIGGVAVGETRKEMIKAVKAAQSQIDEDKIKYVMGVGHPADIIHLVDLGCDCFDSIYPTQNARHGTLFTFDGKLEILKGPNKFSRETIDKTCNCELCKNHTRSYINYLLRNKDPEGKRLASVHNLMFMKRLMQEIRKAIKNNKWVIFKKKMLKAYPYKNETAGTQVCTLS